MKNHVKHWYKKVNHHFQEVLRTKSDPHSLAFGFALATFLSLLPTPGVSILIGLALVLVFERMSKVSMALAYLIFNPFVATPFYAMGYQIGNNILSGIPDETVKLTVMNAAYEFTTRVVLGNLILGAAVGSISYIMVYYFVRYYQKKYH